LEARRALREHLPGSIERIVKLTQSLNDELALYALKVYFEYTLPKPKIKRMDDKTQAALSEANNKLAANEKAARLIVDVLQRYPDAQRDVLKALGDGYEQASSTIPQSS
jgi:hypothetical protein